MGHGDCWAGALDQIALRSFSPAAGMHRMPADFRSYSRAELAGLRGQPQQIPTGQMRSGLVGPGAQSSHYDSAR